MRRASRRRWLESRCRLALCAQSEMGRDERRAGGGGGFRRVLIPIYAASEAQSVTTPGAYHPARPAARKKLFCGLLNLITLPRNAISKITL